MDWRRDLSALEEKYRFLQVTPYEKNVDLWRQLWMVIEKSDILVQIVDCRDPTFFRCRDLERYVNEVGTDKFNFLLLNKADLLEEPIRKVWSQYFNELRVKHIFFSAKEQQNLIDKDLLDEEDVSDAMKFINTPNVVNRGVLKTILKSIVHDFKQKMIDTEAQKVQSEGIKQSETGELLNVDQSAQEKQGDILTPLISSEKDIKAEGEKNTLEQPPKPKMKILKVVDESEIKDKPVFNVQEALYKLKEKELQAKIDKFHEQKHEEGHKHHDHKNADTHKHEEDKSEDYVDDDDDEEEGDEEHDEVEDGEEGKKPMSIYEKLGVDRHSLSSKPFHDRKNDENIVIGMIGFPNVGKSSVINVLCNKKLVGVGARPGKTKNFQTVFLEKHLILCDCPGLVFPSIVHSKAHMVDRINL